MDLGAGYTHVGPSPVAAVLNALRESVKRVREQSGQPVTVQRPSSPWTCASFHARAT